MRHAIVVALAVLLFVPITLVKADTIDCRTGGSCLNGTDFFDWRDNYGAVGNPVPDGSVAVSDGGVTATVDFAGGDGLRLDQGDGWGGSFSPGDELLWTFSSAPLTLLFDTPLLGLGANIERSAFGEFTAFLEVFDAGDILIGSYSKPGITTSLGDGSAIFIGLSNIPGIRSAVFSLNGGANFTINQLDIIPDDGGPAPIPEPGTLLLLGTGLAGLASRRRKRG